MDRRRFIGGIAGSLALAGCGGGSDAPASIPGDASPPGGLVCRMAVGDLLCLPLTFAPTDVLLCNGQSILRGQYPRLFERIGAAFGSDDAASFNLPDLPPLRPADGPPAAWCIVGDTPGLADAPDGLVGEVRLFAYEPAEAVAQAWLPCDGRVLAIRGNQELYSLIGNSFGGDGLTTFALPKVASVPGGAAAPLEHRIAAAGTYPDFGGDALTPSYSDRIDYGTYLPAITRVAYGNRANDLTGYALCAGQTIDLASDWYALYSLLGNRYGGDGTRTFRLPNLPPSAGLSHMLLYGGIYPPRE